MKILKLSSSFPRYKGDFFGPWILEYCQELVKQGHEVTLVAPCPADTPLEFLSEPNLKIIRFNYWYPRKNQKLVYPPGIIPQLKANKFRYLQIPFMLLNYYLTVKNIIKNNQFDIIHSQWVIPSGYIGSKLAKKNNLPHVITSQGAEFFLPVNHPFSKFSKATLSNCDYLFPVSSQMGERALNYGIDKNKIKVIPNSVNTEIFKPTIPTTFRDTHQIAENDFVFLTIRRLVFEKRVEDVIDAFAALKAKGIKNIKLIIGGDGPDKKALQDRCTEKNINEDVIFLGFVNNNELPPIYSACDSYILSSQQEGLSLSLLESMSSGLATITTKSTGGQELIVDGENGFLYDVSSIEQLVNKMESLIQFDKTKIIDLQDKGRDTIINHYSVASMVNSWTAIYKSLLTKKT